MYSLNVPVPGEVHRLATELQPSLMAFDSIRDQHSIVLKRFDAGEPNALMSEARHALRGAPTVAARISNIEMFTDPPIGKAPVLYLAVESPGLHQLHQQLVSAMGSIDGLEGPDYIPHVTLARGAAVDVARQLTAQSIDPITWTVSSLLFVDGRTREPAGTISLPG